MRSADVASKRKRGPGDRRFCSAVSCVEVEIQVAYRPLFQPRLLCLCAKNTTRCRQSIQICGESIRPSRRALVEVEYWIRVGRSAPSFYLHLLRNRARDLSRLPARARSDNGRNRENGAGSALFAGIPSIAGAPPVSLRLGLGRDCFGNELKGAHPGGPGLDRADEPPFRHRGRDRRGAPSRTHARGPRPGPSGHLRRAGMPAFSPPKPLTRGPCHRFPKPGPLRRRCRQQRL
jgi:hypothetical protein